MIIKIHGLEQGFMWGQEKKGGPLDGEPTWQEPLVKKTKQKQNKAPLTDHRVTASLVQSSLFSPQIAQHQWLISYCLRRRCTSASTC